MSSEGQARRKTRFDIDEVGLDGFCYDPAWTQGHPVDVAFGPTLQLVTVGAPLGMEFAVYFVSGWDSEGVPQLDITLSAQLAVELARRLSSSSVNAIWNSSLWSKCENASIEPENME